MTRLLPSAAVVAALALAGCNSGFEPQYRVKDLRFLAIRAHVQGSASADAYPGDTIVLDALVANPLARPGLGVTWFGCFPPADESLPPCADPSFLQDPRKLATDPRVTPLGMGESLTLPIDPALVTSALAFITQVALVPDKPLRCRLFAELVVVAVAEAQGRSVVAMKRVRVTPRPETLPTELQDVYLLNLNPAVVDVVRAPLDRASCGGEQGGAGGTELEAVAFPADQSVLCGVAAPGSVGTFNVCKVDTDTGTVTIEPDTEDLSWQWYVTGGEFPDFSGIGNANGGDVDFTRPPEAFTIWVVLRDGRGGEDWATYVVSAAP